MPRSRYLSKILGATAVAMSVGCATPEPGPLEPVLLTPPAPEELNIPQPVALECDCSNSTTDSESYFDRGIRALAARDYVRARVYFERHDDNGDKHATSEAEVGLAFVVLLEQVTAARAAGEGGSGGDARAEVMALALAAMQALEEQIAAVSARNRALSTELEKREAALKRLRDLTLGAPEG